MLPTKIGISLRLVCTMAFWGASVLLTVSSIEATSWMNTSEDYLISVSDYVIRGKAVDQETKLDEKAQKVYTYTTFEVSEEVVGVSSRHPVIVRTRGGRIGDLEYHIP